ncbi:HaaA family cyclophane-containing RiPP peptide [Streptomyces sp. NPDC005820]|uniref:HaaA family cyclophane-containing RiPP peptide n=1 Tax=Streptomyces sp. NPDC005820 TaxID=3157069 RepID=UPI0033FF5244
MGLDRVPTAVHGEAGDPGPVGPTSVLERVATRVRHRLAVEQASPEQVGEGGHQASLTRPLPR